MTRSSTAEEISGSSMSLLPSACPARAEEVCVCVCSVWGRGGPSDGAVRHRAYNARRTKCPPSALTLGEHGSNEPRGLRHGALQHKHCLFCRAQAQVGGRCAAAAAGSHGARRTERWIMEARCCLQRCWLACTLLQCSLDCCRKLELFLLEKFCRKFINSIFARFRVVAFQCTLHHIP